MQSASPFFPSATLDRRWIGSKSHGDRHDAIDPFFVANGDSIENPHRQWISQFCWCAVISFFLVKSTPVPIAIAKTERLNMRWTLDRCNMWQLQREKLAVNCHSRLVGRKEAQPSFEACLQRHKPCGFVGSCSESLEFRFRPFEEGGWSHPRYLDTLDIYL